MMMSMMAACTNTTKIIHSTDDAELHFKQGITYAARADYDNAILEFQKSINIRSTAKAYSNMGVCYMKTGKVNKALEALQTAVRIDNCDSFAQYNLAAVYSVMDKTDLGIDALDKALQCGFSNYDAIRFDKDLDNLRGEPEFRTTLEKHKVFLQ
jgi:tetratricopeptide (TPR) repeat protein